MRILFKIKENLSEIIDEILHSEKWNSVVIKDQDGRKYVEIRDPIFRSAATVEITPDGILIHTAFSRYSYRIFKEGLDIWCEYNGAYRGLLEQQLLPTLSPLDNLLDIEVSESTLYDIKSKPRKLRDYANDNLTRKRQTGEGSKGTAEFDHPKRVYDEFIKEDYVPPQQRE